MKALTSATIAEQALTVTSPGYFIRLGYSSVLRLSTMGDLSWAGQAWSSASVRVSGMGQDGGAANTGTITLGNADLAYGALILNEGASDIPVSVWAVYAGATASGDPVLQFEGVTDGATFSEDHMQVSMSLVAQGVTTLYSPRRFINKASGFNFLQPAGTKIVFGNETFVLERG